QVDLLVRLCANRLPVAPPAYGDDDLTDRSERFLAGELVREKLFRLLGDELPSESTLLTSRYGIRPGLRRGGAAGPAGRVREKAVRVLGHELAYESTVLIEQYEILPGLRRVGAVVLVERESQKAIVLGKGGERIKRIASEARVDLERLVGTKVFLEIFVKV